MPDKYTIVIQFDEPVEGFRQGEPYHVISQQGKEFLLVDETGRFRWIPAEVCRAWSVASPETTVFDRAWFEIRKKYDALLGKKVAVKSLEDMGVPGETRDEQGLFTLTATLDSFERDLITLVDDGDPPLVAKVIHRQIYSIEEVG